MRRFICLMLALLLCVAMPMTALAATASPGNYAPDASPKTGDTAMMELWVPVLVISAIALAVVALIYFKKIRKAN